MQTKILSRDAFLSAATQSGIEHRVARALRRFETQIRLVAIRLADIGGSGVGKEHHCHITARFLDGRSVGVALSGKDVIPLVERVANRVAYAIQGQPHKEDGIRENVPRRAGTISMHTRVDCCDEVVSAEWAQQFAQAHGEKGGLPASDRKD